MLAAVSLATTGRDAASKTARTRAINAAVRAVSELLGNTPAVGRTSYIDPAYSTATYLSGWTIAGDLDRIPDLETAEERGRPRIEAAVLDLLTGNTDSPALERELEPVRAA